jgi:hypothetical protein
MMTFCQAPMILNIGPMATGGAQRWRPGFPGTSRIAGAFMGGRCAPKIGAADRKTRHLRHRCTAAEKPPAVTDEILAKRFERGLQSATKGRNRRLSGESQLNCVGPIVANGHKGLLSVAQRN